ncbi:MAG: hypothetical protein KTR32_14880 [Granulosicoccus sp.]|nr:hypothetical protein [Granulosicoccus sp.]
MTFYKSLVSAVLLSFAVLVATSASVQAAEPINTLEKGLLFGYNESGTAIRGYDTVAYFTQSKPVEGLDKYSTEWKGATWKFSSQEHLDLFKNDPDKYAPQYGGYCAYGVSQDALVKIEPEFWSIIDDKLYLNYDAGVQKTWESDISGYISAADKKIDALLK